MMIRKFFDCAAGGLPFSQTFDSVSSLSVKFAVPDSSLVVSVIFLIPELIA
jgi:hypothetical protein